MINTTKIFLAEDHTIVRDGIKLLLKDETGYEIIGEAINGVQALNMLENLSPDILLVDVNMPEMDGISLIKALREKNNPIKIVVLSMLDNEKYVKEALESGAEGYLLKSVSSTELLFALNLVTAGGKYICAELSVDLIGHYFRQQPALAAATEHVDFSLREIEVLQLIAEGLTNAEMSEKLFLSKRTVEGHRQSLLDKTHSKNSASLIRFAVLNGIIK